MLQAWLLSCIVLLSIWHTNASLTVLVTNDTFVSRTAAFGPKLSKAGQLGYLVEPLDPSGCHWVESPMSNWVALVHRGGCSFATKVRAMEQSGAIGVVIGDLDRQQWVTMHATSDSSDISIPSVFVAQNEYKSLLYLASVLDKPMLVYMDSDDFIWPLHDIIMILLVAPITMLTLFYLLCKIRQQHRKLQNIAPVHVVSKLALEPFNPDEASDGHIDSCAICLEDYLFGEQLRVLPCKHNFHPHCVDAWLTTKKKYCPLCKLNISIQ
ncbi:hypothetical protein BC940DRAFT_313431 [Gongronella butleri]|nr:hypothetical protein BC940DRAFT_313431 [Gongronella butleri]